MLPSYTDSEVGCFHPICEQALTQALRRLGQQDAYQVLHHQHTGALEMDFVIQNKNTGKYLCVIEVKRTPADVHSARYQFQAMSYVQMNAEESEKPFYILTNLEHAVAFRYDAARPRVFQQMLEPGFSTIGSFTADSEAVFVDKLTAYFAERINEYLRDSYGYLVTLDEFARHMEQIKNDPRKWKSHLAVLLYEYIRGAFSFVQRDELRDVRLFRDDVARICGEAARVNFKGIFDYNTNDFEDSTAIGGEILADLYDFGRQNVDGDSVAGLLHTIVSAGHEHDGEVPTDLELAVIVAELAKHSSGELQPGDLLCDPAAGSGNLISAAIRVYNLMPTQIVANDVNRKLLELLSLRLGLNYAQTIRPENSSAIYSQNIADMDAETFSQVKVVVMNPPFLAGINCVERKRPFYTRIREITGHDAETNAGQMPLEAVFLELLIELVQRGTTVACVFPQTHLTGCGIEDKAIRQLLLGKFGLHTIFTYPGNEIFDDVTKDTCVLVGRAKEPSERINVISSYEKIPNLDTHRFSQSLSHELTDEFTTTAPGVVAKAVDRALLMDEAGNGWRMLSREMAEAVSFVEEVFQNTEHFAELGTRHYPLKRGTAGNNGGSDLLFFDSREDLYEQFRTRPIHLAAGMHNSKLDRFVVGLGDSAFLDIEDNDEALVDEIIDAYNALPPRTGRQRRWQKDKQTWLSILRKESRNIFDANSVLIPRAIRTTGRIYMTRNPVFVSTNFVVCSLPSEEEALLLSTWMSTIFYQLICEVSSKDQEGMRKMEVINISHTLVPDFRDISRDAVDRLKAEAETLSFLQLETPEIREVDRIWAAELFGGDAERTLQRAQRLLGYLACGRNTH